MYVFVTVTELEGPGREQDLGERAETISLQQIKEIVLNSIETHLPPDAREDPRHFWHLDRIQRNDTLLSDLAAESDIVSLELRLDTYRVSMPGVRDRPAAFNPEWTAADFIEMTSHGKHAGPCCYEVRVGGSDKLEPDKDLFAQGALPGSDLALRHRRVYYLWTAGALIVSAVCGLVLGYFLPI